MVEPASDKAPPFCSADATGNRVGCPAYIVNNGAVSTKLQFMLLSKIYLFVSLKE
jgi:hypothetical protein